MHAHAMPHLHATRMRRPPCPAAAPGLRRPPCAIRAWQQRCACTAGPPATGERPSSEQLAAAAGEALSDGMAASSSYTTDLDSSKAASSSQAKGGGSGSILVVSGLQLQAEDERLAARFDPRLAGTLSPRVHMGSFAAKGARESMEDAHVLAALHPELGVLEPAGPTDGVLQLPMAGVFDGHAGAATARYAAQRLPSLLHAALLRRQLYDCFSDGSQDDVCDIDTQGAVASAFRRFDRWWNDARTDPKLTQYGWDESGATAVVGLVAGGSLLVGNAGDSAALLARGGAPQRLSVEDRPDRNEEEAQRVVDAGGRLVVRTPGGAVRVVGSSSQTRFRGTMVTRSLGDFAWKHPQPLLLAEPHTQAVPLLPGRDRLVLLASDGVTDVLDDAQMVELGLEAAEAALAAGEWGGDAVAASGAAAVAAARAVVAGALGANTRDNATVVAMLLDWSEVMDR